MHFVHCTNINRSPQDLHINNDFGAWVLWQYGLWSFQAGGTKSKRFLHKNQHTQRKLLNFEFWINEKCAPKLVYFSEKN